MLGPWRVDDEVGAGEAIGETDTERYALLTRLEPSGNVRGRHRSKRARVLRSRSPRQQVDVLDAIAPFCVHDLGLAREEAVLGIERDKERVRTVRHVFNEAGRQL